MVPSVTTSRARLARRGFGLALGCRCGQLLMLGRIQQALVFGTAALAPVPFGSADPFWSVVWCVPLGLSLAVAALGPLTRNAVRALCELLLLLGLVGCVLALQTSVAQDLLPQDLGDGAAPVSLDFWREAARVLGTDLGERARYDGGPPFAGLGTALSPALAFAAGLAVAAHVRRSSVFLGRLAMIGAALAIGALALHVYDDAAVLWKDKLHHAGFLTATFYNRNVAAAYFGLFFVAAVTWVVCRRQRLMRAAHRRADEAGGMVFSAGLLSILALAMLLTGSRAGVASALGGAALACVLATHGRLPHGMRRFTWVVALIAVGAVLAEILGQGLAHRFSSSAGSDRERWLAYQSTWQLILDHPWLGVGPGNFADAFARYRSTGMSAFGVWDRAHNVYLQVMAEVGMPAGFAIIAGGLLWTVRLARTGWRTGAFLPIAGAGVAFSALAHALVDYPAQIPGYSIPAAAFLGLALGHQPRPAFADRALPNLPRYDPEVQIS